MRFWTILALVVALNAGVAALMYLGLRSDAPAPEKPIRAASALSTRNMAPAEGAPYNYQQMAFGGAIMVVCGIGLVAFIRRQTRQPTAS